MTLRRVITGHPDHIAAASLVGGSMLTNLLVLWWLGIRHGGDTYRYVKTADDLLAQQRFVGYEEMFVGYSGAIAVSRVMGLGEGGVIVFQFGLAALAAIALYDVGCQLAGRFAGLAAAVLFIVDVDIARWHVYVLTDSPYISVVVLATWAIYRASGHVRRYLAAAALGLLAAATRPNGWIFGPVAVTYWISRTQVRRRTKLLAAAGVAVLCAVVALSLGPLRRGYTPAPIDRQSVDAMTHHDPAPAWVPGLDSRFRRDHGGLVEMATTRVLLELIHARSFYSARHNALILASILIAYPLAVLGWAGAADRQLANLLAAVIAGHLALVALTFADHDGRYLLYVFPLIGALASVGADSLWRALRGRNLAADRRISWRSMIG